MQLKPLIFALLVTILITSSTNLVSAEIFAPKRVDADIVAKAKETYNKDVQAAKKIYDSQAKKSESQLNERKEIAQKFWEGVLYVVAKNDKTILLNAKKIQDTYILKAKKLYDQELALAKIVFDDAVSQAKAKYSDDLAKSKMTK